MHRFIQHARPIVRPMEAIHVTGYVVEVAARVIDQRENVVVRLSADEPNRQGRLGRVVVDGEGPDTHGVRVIGRS